MRTQAFGEAYKVTDPLDGGKKTYPRSERVC